MAFFDKHTSPDLVRWTAKGVADETGQKITVRGRAVYVGDRKAIEGSNEELFGYLNGLADGFMMAKEKKR